MARWFPHTVQLVNGRSSFHERTRRCELFLKTHPEGRCGKHGGGAAGQQDEQAPLGTAPLRQRQGAFAGGDAVGVRCGMARGEHFYGRARVNVRPLGCGDDGMGRLDRRHHGGVHRPGGLSSGNDVPRSIRVWESGQRGQDETAWMDRIDSGTEDVPEIVAKAGERKTQCSCFGSDQAERPVTALNLRSSPAINWSALSHWHKCSSSLSTRARA